jgi:MoaA/NifB/PqqE/SkfB family radical SAM enzyme
MNIKRIEFIVTYQCSGNCKHCSIGDSINCSSPKKVNIDKAKIAIQKLSQLFNIESIMTFGGEPLLYAEETCAIHETAKNCSIPRRDIITNGYFSKDKEKTLMVAQSLVQSGVNNILLSVDAFHQEKVPVEFVYYFAEKVIEQGYENIKLHPAWLVNKEHDNQYNQQTKHILEQFSHLNIKISSGNDIFLSGNAAKYLSSYYEKKDIDLTLLCGKFPYTTPLDKIDTISITPNGDVNVCCFVIGNIYNEDIEEIVNRYNPYENPYMNIILNKGVRGLLDYANEHEVSLDTSDLYSACSICRALVNKMSKSTGL